MITQADFEVLPVRKEWTDIGVDYALRSWTQTFNRLGKKNIYSRLSKIIVGVVAEQATRAALESYKIEFDSAGATKWYAIDRYDMGVRGKAIDIKSIFVDRDNRLQIRKLARVGCLPDLQNNLIKFTALVPEDQFNSASAKNRAGREKIYVFPVVDAHSVVSPSVGRNCHLMWDYRWLKKAEEKDSVKLGKLAVKSQRGGKIRLIGTTSKNNLVVEDIMVDKSGRETKNSFWQLFAIELIGKQAIDLVVKTEFGRLTEKIQAKFGFEFGSDGEHLLQNDWMSVGLGSGTVYVCGFATDRTLRVKGRSYPRYSKDVLQYPDTLISNWGLSFQELSPWSKLSSV
jgi:hypothetical protein